MGLALLLLALSPRERLAALAKDYGVEIRVVSLVTRVSRDDYSVIAMPVPKATLERYLPILEGEWRRYPASLMARVGLRRIVVGADVRVEGQPRAVVPEFGPGWLWVDAAVGAKNPDYGRRALNHDWFHMIDRRMAPGADGRDPAWASLNPKGFRYGIGGWWMRTKGVGDLRKDLPGFLTAYSTSAVEEDKAELFSHLVDDPAFVAARAAADPVIRTKVERLKSTLLDFDPDLGPSWWSTAAGR